MAGLSVRGLTVLPYLGTIPQVTGLSDTMAVYFPGIPQKAGEAGFRPVKVPIGVNRIRGEAGLPAKGCYPSILEPRRKTAAQNAGVSIFRESM